MSACIVVVGEDDYGYGYGHGLHGTTWYLEVIWIGGHSHRAHNRGYGMSFRTEQEMSGTAGCASFTADYSLNDDEIRINRFRTSTFGCQDDELQTLFLENLPEANDLTLDNEQLQVSTADGVRMTFSK